MIIGSLPVVIAVVSNRRDGARDGKLPWRQLVPSLVLIVGGIALVNQAELERLPSASATDHGRYATGALLAIGAVACWTWYPLRNADWLRAHAERSAGTWATAQGLATLPLAALAGLVLWGAGAGLGDGQFPLPLGPTPVRFLALMFAVGLFASWLGTLCWNEASQRLPTAVVGQLIVFETLAALSYAFALRGQLPGAVTVTGITLLLAGVFWALRTRAQPLAAGPPA
jgi:drug/metabolite transporter (DMT)-like permease